MNNCVHTSYANEKLKTDSWVSNAGCDWPIFYPIGLLGLVCCLTLGGGFWLCTCLSPFGTCKKINVDQLTSLKICAVDIQVVPFSILAFDYIINDFPC